MNESINAKKLKEFINTEVTEELTPQEEMRKVQSLNFSILAQAEEQLTRAFKNNDTAMVAAIAEVLKSI